MENIIKSIEPAIQELSDLFCVSVETIRENGMEYVLMYGKYRWVTNISNSVLVSSVIFALAFALALIFVATFSDYDYMDCAEKKNFNKNAIKTLIISYSVLVLIVIISISIPYWVSPEMYSIKAVMDLVSGV